MLESLLQEEDIYNEGPVEQHHENIEETSPEAYDLGLDLGMPATAPDIQFVPTVEMSDDE